MSNQYDRKQITWELVGSCWRCTSHSSVSSGYPCTSYRGKTVTIVRYWWIERHGEVPKGLYLRHKCDHRWCINMDHIELGTPRQNEHDKKRAGTWQGGENNRNHKLTWNDVDLIRDRARNGERRSVLAREFNIAKSSIDMIVNGQRWNWRPRPRDYTA